MTCPRSLEWIQSCCLVAKSCPTLCNPTDYSTPGFLVLHHLLEFAHKLMVIESVMPFNHLIICHPFSSCPQSFPASGSFQMSQLFTSGGQSIGVSASTSVLPMKTQDWSPLELTGWISLQSKGVSRVFSNTTVQSINSLVLSFIVQLSHLHMTTGKIIALTRRIFVGKVMSLLFNMLSI